MAFDGARTNRDVCLMVISNCGVSQMFYGALCNHSYEKDAELAAVDAQDEARRATDEIERVKMDIERLLLISEALWLLLKEEHGYDDETLARYVTEVDARDGRVDGKRAPVPPQPCPYCQRPLGRNRPCCIYCGQRVPSAIFAR